MHLQQLSYIVSVADCRHFAKAAEKNLVTQPTLSMMIQKLEEELQVKIFDRSKHPVTLTREGLEVVERARHILAEVEKLKEFALELKGDAVGEMRIGIIPTLAPYLVPLFIRSFSSKYASLRIDLRELAANAIQAAVKAGQVDIGLLSGPLKDPQLAEYPLFEEEFFVYASPNEKLPRKKWLNPRQIDISHLWLLEEGDCFRKQVLQLLQQDREIDPMENLKYDAGSIESLINLVDRYHGFTIIPQLSSFHLSTPQKRNIREFAHPKPARQVCLVCLKSYPRKKLLDQLKEEIMLKIPFSLGKEKKMVLWA